MGRALARWTSPALAAHALLLGACSDAPRDAKTATDAPASRGAEAARARPTVVLGRLRIVDDTPADRRPWAATPEQLEGPLRAALTAAGVQTSAPAATDWLLTAKARVVYGLGGPDGALRAIPEAGPAAARWQVELALRVPGEPAPIESVFEGRGEARFEGPPEALGPELTRLLTEGLAGLTADVSGRLDVLTRPVAELLALLDDASPVRRRLAVDRLATLRSLAAVPALGARLRREEDRVLRLRIVGALAELGDPRAADALVAIADPKDRELLVAIVDTLALLGGPSAVAFLDVLADHDAPEVRALVAQARERMKSNERRRP
jgi:hypothetical protein